MDANLDLVLRVAVLVPFLSYLYYVKKKRSNERLDKWLFNFKVEVGNPLFTVLVPVLIMAMLRTFWKGVLLPEGNFVLLLMAGVLLGPFFEELVMRAGILGFFMTVSARFSRLNGYLFLALGLVFQSALFMSLHFRGFNIPWIVDGIVFGLLFILSGRNLVPCTVAHMTKNFLIIVRVL